MQKKKCTVHSYSAAPDVTQFLELEDMGLSENRVYSQL